MRAPEAGLTLLEVLVALTILLLTGLPLMSLARDEVDRLSVARRTERQLQQASQAMIRMTLLPRTDLERRIGSHPAPPFVLDIQRPTSKVFRVAIYDSAASHQPLLVTLLYRP